MSTSDTNDEAERIEAAIRFVADERKGVEPWRVGVEIMTLRRCGARAWPEGNAEQWEDAVKAAVKAGRLVLKDDKVKIPPMVVEKKVVQAELF